MNFSWPHAELPPLPTVQLSKIWIGLAKRLSRAVEVFLVRRMRSTEAMSAIRRMHSLLYFWMLKCRAG